MNELQGNSSSSYRPPAVANERADRVSTRIGQKLLGASPTSSYFSIFKVPDQLRKVNEKAYEPQILAIGPYHRGKDHKIRFLQMLLGRRNENSVTRYVMTMRSLEESARRCYGESVNPCTDDFVEMLLLDGCFIVEVIRKFAMKDDTEPIFKMRSIFFSLKRDMLLLENQVPFFVLLELFRMTLMPNQQDNFVQMIFGFFDSMMPGLGYAVYNEYDFEDTKHLLGLIHDNWLPSPERMDAFKKAERKEKWEFIRCATELQESGIKFKKVEGGSLFDIRFENGVMEIPTLKIEDRTESFFRNLIAYEQCSEDEDLNYVVDYITLIDRLINSAKDVELLRDCGIIDNWLGDDEVISTMFNRLGDSVILSFADFYYSEIFNKVNMHCGRRWNR